MYLKRKITYSFSIVYLVLMFFVPSNLYAMEQESIDEKRVLIVNSYNNMTDWTNSLIKSFAERIGNISDEVVEIRIEYLNAIVNKESDYGESFRQMLNSKYKNYDADVIITIGPQAFSNMSQEVVDKNSIFYQTPIVFRALSKYSLIDKNNIEFITGEYHNVNFTKIINLVMDLNKESNKIKIIMGETDLKVIPEYRKRQQLIKNIYSGYIQIEFVAADYIEDILENIRQEECDDYRIIIGGNYYSKELKRLLTSDEIVHRIKEIREVPIYTYDATYVLGGTIGGIVRLPKKTGIKLAEDVNDILSGEEIPPIRTGIDEYVFDYKEIYKNDVMISQIPRDSIIVNRKKFELLLPKSIKLLIAIGVRVVIIIGGCILFTIYKQHQLAKKNKKLYEQAKLQEQIRTDFITGLSHDLKTPINIIRSSVQLMTSSDEEIEQEYLHKRMKIINQNANRLLRLVNNIMDVIKLEETSYYKMKLQNVNLVEIVEDICSGTVDYMKQRELNFIFDTEEEEIITAVDREKIERVILNLLSNAIKFTPSQGNIYVYMEKVNDNVYITIKDSGIGIEKDKLDAIFLKFYQVDNTVTKPGEGSGVGLYIVKKLIELHEGEIFVESKVGEGTIFKILLPIKEMEASEANEISIRGGVDQAIQVEFADL